MYSDKRSILQLVSLLKLHDIQHIVLCPGSRNAPIVHSLSVDASFFCYAVTDERSAGFYALGIALERGAPVAVCCTSGSALVNLYPAVAEAYYQRVPLVIISADRPEAWIGQMDGQTLPQPNVFGSLCRCAVNLPIGDREDDEWLCNRRINEALIAVRRHRGPVHINIPLAEPLFTFTTPTLPEVRKISLLPRQPEAVRQLALKAERPLIIVGQLTVDEAQRLVPKLTSLTPHAVVLGEHLSNSYQTLGTFDALLATLDAEQLTKLQPDLVITLGGHIISKRLKQWLRQYPPLMHWHIAPEGEVADLFSGALTHICDEEQWFAMASSLPQETLAATPYQSLWQDLGGRVPEPEPAYSALAAAGALMHRMPQGSVLHLANSLSVRLAQLYRLTSDVSVQCNRGVNGIEGSLSAAMGYASVSEELNFVLIGDLSFFYDMNVLCTPLRSNVRIVVLNNSGGGIFSTLPGLSPQADSYGYIVGQQQRSVRLWAEDSGLVYRSVQRGGELEEAIEELCSPALEKPMLVEVLTDMQTDSLELNKYYNELSQLLNK